MGNSPQSVPEVSIQTEAQYLSNDHHFLKLIVCVCGGGTSKDEEGEYYIFCTVKTELCLFVG